MEDLQQSYWVLIQCFNTASCGEIWLNSHDAANEKVQLEIYVGFLQIKTIKYKSSTSNANLSQIISLYRSVRAGLTWIEFKSVSEEIYWNLTSNPTHGVSSKSRWRHEGKVAQGCKLDWSGCIWLIHYFILLHSRLKEADASMHLKNLHWDSWQAPVLQWEVCQ